MAEDGDLADAALRAAARDPRVLARIGPVARDDVQTHMNAADVLALPYQHRDALTARGAENRRHAERFDWSGTAEILRAHYQRA
jgi:hypothetical protein